MCISRLKTKPTSQIQWYLPVLVFPHEDVTVDGEPGTLDLREQAHQAVTLHPYTGSRTNTIIAYTNENIHVVTLKVRTKKSGTF